MNIDGKRGQCDAGILSSTTENMHKTCNLWSLREGGQMCDSLLVTMLWGNKQQGNRIYPNIHVGFKFEQRQNVGSAGDTDIVSEYLSKRYSTI